MPMSEIVMLGIDDDWRRWLWVELDIDFENGDGDEPGIIVVDYD